jgi:hypothetical protein
LFGHGGHQSGVRAESQGRLGDEPFTFASS